MVNAIMIHGQVTGSLAKQSALVMMCIPRKDGQQPNIPLIHFLDLLALSEALLGPGQS